MLRYFCSETRGLPTPPLCGGCGNGWGVASKGFMENREFGPDSRAGGVGCFSLLCGRTNSVFRPCPSLVVRFGRFVFPFFRGIRPAQIWGGWLSGSSVCVLEGLGPGFPG